MHHRDDAARRIPSRRNSKVFLLFVLLLALGMVGLLGMDGTPPTLSLAEIRIPDGPLGLEMEWETNFVLRRYRHSHSIIIARFQRRVNLLMTPTPAEQGRSWLVLVLKHDILDHISAGGQDSTLVEDIDSTRGLTGEMTAEGDARLTNPIEWPLLWNFDAGGERSGAQASMDEYEPFGLPVPERMLEDTWTESHLATWLIPGCETKIRLLWKARLRSVEIGDDGPVAIVDYRLKSRWKWKEASEYLLEDSEITNQEPGTASWRIDLAVGAPLEFRLEIPWRNPVDLALLPLEEGVHLETRTEYRLTIHRLTEEGLSTLSRVLRFACRSCGTLYLFLLR